MRSVTSGIALDELVDVGGIDVGVPVGIRVKLSADVLDAVSVAATVGVTVAGSSFAGLATGVQAVAMRIERITKNKDFPFFILIISTFLRLIDLFIIVTVSRIKIMAVSSGVATGMLVGTLIADQTVKRTQKGAACVPCALF